MRSTYVSKGPFDSADTCDVLRVPYYVPTAVLGGALGVPCIRNPLHAELNSPPEGDVVSDHGVGLLLGERWWAHPLKDIMAGFRVDNAAIVWEDIELKFYSEIGYKMDNEYFDWENHGGKWVKVKKTREP